MLMPENKNQETEIDRSGIQFTSDANTGINTHALSSADDSDEMSLAEALQKNGFVLAMTRFLIKLKNHVSIIPMLMTVISMILITCTMHTHIIALNQLGNNRSNSFFFFVNNILAVVSCLVYLNVFNKKSSMKKQIIFLVLFFLVMGGELVINFMYLRDANIQLNLTNSINKVVDTDNHDIAKSLSLTNLHNVFVILTLALSVIAPIVQPFTKKIHIGFRKKKQ